MYVNSSIPRYAPPRRLLRGLGDSSDSDTNLGKQTATGVASGLTVGVATANATGSAVAGSIAGALEMIAPFAGPAGPFIAAAGALIGPVMKLFSGCGATCTQATQYANQAGAALEQLVAQYFAQPIRYKSSQTAALSAMTQVFNAMQNSCSNPALGKAGRDCISQRLDASACQWHASAGSFNNCTWIPFGANGSGSTCWNWIVGYYDPVANDPCVVPDPPISAISAAGSSLLSSLGVDTSTLPGWALPAALIALAVIFL